MGLIEFQPLESLVLMKKIKLYIYKKKKITGADSDQYAILSEKLMNEFLGH